MLNSLPLIIVMISSLFLAFYCVDSHKENILSTVNMDKKNLEPVSVKIEKNLITEEVYVEALAVEDRNETSKIISKIESEPQIVIEEVAPPIEVEQEIKKVEPIKEVKVIEKIKTEDKITSEYSEGYKLDDLEKMIMEELKKGNKD